MSNDDFKDIYKDSPPVEKLGLLIDSVRNECHADFKAADALGRNKDKNQYWNREYHAMRDRASWLYEELVKILTDKN